MTIAENIAFPLQMRKVPRAETHKRVAEALERVRLGHLGARRPSQLSGGQQQRVALARALVFEPRVILLDEPLGALDKNLREEMQLELRDLHHRLGLTFIFVTHDQGEALTMSDRIAVFDKGRIAQIGTPSEIYDKPDNLFVAGFVGETNLLDGEVVANGSAAVMRLTPEIAIPAPKDSAVGKAILSIRPERIHIADHGHDIHLPALVKDVVYQGDHTRLRLEMAGFQIIARVPRGTGNVAIGQNASIGIDVENCRVFAK